MKRWLRILFQILSLLLFVIILWRAGSDSWQKVIQGDWYAIVWALFFHAATTIISAIRLKIVAESLSDSTSFPVFQYYYLNIIARALGIVLPRSVSGIGGRAVGLKTLGVSLPRAIWIVVIDNVFDVLLLVTMSLAAILNLYFHLDILDYSIVLVMCILTLYGLIYWLTADNRAITILNSFQKFSFIAKRLNSSGLSDSVIFPGRKKSAIIFSCTILLNGFLILSYYFMGVAVAVNTKWITYLLSFPIAQLSLIIAIVPGGMGIFDLGWLGTLRLNGVEEAMALNFVVAQRAYVTVFILIFTGFAAILSLFLIPKKKATNLIDQS